jgi:meso-butanediol dehydrogenase/(S,S)-butanediol dehydrogenase/diacetyl reductase
MRLLGHTALVTGASRGLGLGFVKALAAAGAEVWAVSEHTDELERACASVRGEAPLHPIIADLRRRSDAGRVVAAIQQARGALSVLVNNAAVLPLKSLSDTDDSTWDATIAVNLTAPFVLTRLAVPLMRASGGSIVNVSSRAGIEGFACEAAYCATKFGLEGFTKSIALELEPLGIAVNTATPGAKIKPTGVEQAVFDALAAEEQAQYRDPATFAPAIELLASLRGRPSGMRFDLARLTDDVERLGFDTALADAALLAEFRTRDLVDHSRT